MYRLEFHVKRKKKPLLYYIKIIKSYIPLYPNDRKSFYKIKTALKRIAMFD